MAGRIICLHFILQVLTANIGTLLDVYGVEKGLEHFRSTSSLNFEHYKYYLQKEVLVLYIKALELLIKYNFHEYVIFVYLSRLPDRMKLWNFTNVLSVIFFNVQCANIWALSYT